MNNASKWILILKEYPLSDNKYKLIRRSSDSIKMGILTDHLMGVASKLKIPNIYIIRLKTLRSNVRSDKNYWILKLIDDTNLLLSAACARIKELTSATQK